MSKQTWLRAFASLAVGSLVTVLTAKLEPKFVAGSIPDLICGLIFLPGQLFAILFHDHGNASPEFLWKVWIFTAVIISAFSYFIMRPKKRLG
jgi:hypothetical protein